MKKNRPRDARSQRQPGPNKEIDFQRLRNGDIRWLQTSSNLRVSSRPLSDQLTELSVERPGTLTLHAVVPTDTVGSELVDKLAKKLPELPQRRLKKGEGAVDLRLEDPDGNHVKSGAVVLEGSSGGTPISIDPNSRRFRSGSLP